MMMMMKIKVGVNCRSHVMFPDMAVFQRETRFKVSGTFWPKVLTCGKFFCFPPVSLLGLFLSKTVVQSSFRSLEAKDEVDGGSQIGYCCEEVGQ